MATGVANLVAYFGISKSGNSPWMLVDGIVTLFLGFMMWSRGSLRSMWIIGTLVGISMMMTGTTRLTMVLAARRLGAYFSDRPLREPIS